MALNIPPGTPWRGYDQNAYAPGAPTYVPAQGGGSPQGQAYGPNGTGAPPGSNVITGTDPVGAPGQDLSQGIGSISALGGGSVTGTNLFAPNANATVLGGAASGVPNAVTDVAQIYASQPNVSGGGNPIDGTAQGPQDTGDPRFQATYDPGLASVPSTEQPQSPGPLTELGGAPTPTSAGSGWGLQLAPAGGAPIYGPNQPGPNASPEEQQAYMSWIWNSSQGLR